MSVSAHTQQSSLFPPSSCVAVFSEHISSAGCPVSPEMSVPVNTFASAEDVWFWFINAREATLDGAKIRAGLASLPRPCEPLDVMQIIDRLYRNRRLLRDHFLVLRHYGVRHMPPDSRRPKEARAAFLWGQAMAVLEEAFIAKGILSPRDLTAEVKAFRMARINRSKSDRFFNGVPA